MKKTLLVTMDFYPALGGVSTYWLSLSRHLPSDKWVVLAPPLPAGVQELPSPYRVYRRRFVSRWFVPRWIPLLFHIFDIARREYIEHIIVGQILPVGTAVRLISRTVGISYSVSTHGMDVTLPRGRKKWLCRWILRGAKRVFTISSYTAAHLEKLGVIRDRISFIYPCPSITPDVYRDTDESLHFRTAKHILLTVGRLVKRKGHTDVIRALLDLLKEFPDLMYGIIGEGEEHAAIQKTIDELELNHRVYLLGELDNEKTAWWYQHASVFIMTPKDINGDVEGFGIVYLEANSFGKPVIASRSGGIPDAVIDGETGILVPPGDIHSITGAIRTLLHDDTLRTRLGTQGQERALKEFDWKVQAEKISSVVQ